MWLFALVTETVVGESVVVIKKLLQMQVGSDRSLKSTSPEYVVLLWHC